MEVFCVIEASLRSLCAAKSLALTVILTSKSSYNIQPSPRSNQDNQSISFGITSVPRGQNHLAVYPPASSLKNPNVFRPWRPSSCLSISV